MKRSSGTPDSPRRSRETPVGPYIALAVAFVALVIAAVLTVLVPALEDDGDDPDEAATNAPH
jgi:hypothetical protein